MAPPTDGQASLDDYRSIPHHPRTMVIKITRHLIFKFRPRKQELQVVLRIKNTIVWQPWNSGDENYDRRFVSRISKMGPHQHMQLNEKTGLEDYTSVPGNPGTLGDEENQSHFQGAILKPGQPAGPEDCTSVLGNCGTLTMKMTRPIFKTESQKCPHQH